MHIIIISELVCRESIALVFVLSGPILLLQLLELPLFVVLLDLLNHIIVASVEDILAPLKLTLILWKEPVNFLHCLVVHLHQLLSLVLNV